MKIIVNHLVIELTRRCNMQCEHCLRGDAEQVDIDHKVLQEIAKQINCIDVVTFTGGEPSLNWRGINFFLKLCKHYNTEIANFYTTTNGKTCPDEFILALVNLYAFCTDNQVSMIEISNSVFHETEQSEEAIKKLQALACTSMRRRLEHDFIINRGRAKKNKIGILDKKVENKFEINTFEDIITIEEMYINCYGDLYADYDLSYEQQRKLKQFNIKNGLVNLIENQKLPLHESCL